MDLCRAFELGGDIEYVKHIVCHAEGAIIKDRKRTGPAGVIDILRRILNELAVEGFNDDTQDLVTAWITKFEREYEGIFYKIILKSI